MVWNRNYSLYLCLAAALAVLVALAPAPSRGSADAGRVNLTRPAASDFDRFTSAPSARQRSFMRERFWRMRTYAPYFDSRLSWFPDAWTYRDLYAIYRGGRLAATRPEWILRDSAGRKLYIPFECDGGTCPQYAGDIGNPAFRAHWINHARAQARAYRGIFVDDVNMEPRVSYGNGEQVAPIDPRTGQPMSDDTWRRNVATFATEIRAAMPDKEIVHNALWFAGHQDPAVVRQLDAATHVEIERGAGDPGLIGGAGPYGYETFLAHIDWLHERGKAVVLDSYADTRADVEYELATYFLVSTGRDSLGSAWRSEPGDWWPGYDVALGAPKGERYAWRGLLRRDFAGGHVLVNQPGRSPVRVRLGAGALDPAGVSRPAVTLGPASGAVVVRVAATWQRALRAITLGW